MTTNIYQRTIVFEDCFTCGMPIAMTPNQKRQFDEQGMAIKCVLGHGTERRQSEVQKLQHQLRQSQDQLASVETAYRNLRGLLEATEKKASKLQKRLRNGVCPHCHRAFQQLARHMKSQHPQE